MDSTQQPTARATTPPGAGNRTTHVYVAPQLTSVNLPPERRGLAAPTQVKPRATGPQINWGSVAKGAAIVAGVVLVGVVGAWLLSSVALPALMANPFTANLLGTMATGTHAAVDIAAGVGQIGWNSLVTVGTGLNTGFGVAATTPAPFLFVQNTLGAAAGWIGGLGASLLALPIAAKQMAMLHFVDPGLTAPPASDMTAATMASKKTTIIHQQPVQHFGAHDAVMPDPTDSLIDDSAVQASNKVMKVAHRAAEDGHEYHQSRAARDILARSTGASRSWADRAAALRQSAAPQPVASRRAASFAENLEADVARQGTLPDGGRA